MRTTIYLLSIVLLFASCAGRQQGKATDEEVVSVTSLEEQYSQASDPLEKFVLLDQIAKAKAQTLTGEEFGEYFLLFKVQLDSLIDEINSNEKDYLYERYGLHHDDKGNEITPPDWVQEKEKRYAEAGLYPKQIGEGFEEFRLADDYYSQNFDTVLPQDVKEYLELKEKEGEIVSDGGLWIEFSELADEILRYENFIAKHPRGKLLNEVNEKYFFYQDIYLNGIDNSPVKNEKGRLLPEAKAELQRFVNAHPDSPTAKLAKIVLEDKTVADMFLLLPDEAFDGAYPPVLRRKMMERPDETHVIQEGEETYCGCAIFVEGGNVIWANCESSFPEFQVYLWHLSGNKRLVTVVDRYGPSEDIAEITAYWYKEGTLEKDEEFYAFVNDSSHYAAGVFYDLEKVSGEWAKRAEEIFYPTPFLEYDFDVSPNGEISIKAYYDNPYEYNNYDILEPLNNFYLQFKRVDGKWTKKRIKK